MESKLVLTDKVNSYLHINNKALNRSIWGIDNEIKPQALQKM